MGDAITATADNSGGSFLFKVTAAASTNATVVKAGPGLLYGWALEDFATPAAAHSAYLKFYDKATTPVPGTDTPVFSVALTSTTTYAAVAEFYVASGIKFVNGISYAITALPADNDTTVLTGTNQCNGVLCFR